jgi:predicted nuclease of predicted toxin-antitoxin system
VKIKLDENLPLALVADLAALGHDMDTVPMEGLAGKNDSSVWGHTQHEERFFITQDLDFSNIRRFSPGTHHGLLLVRLACPSRSALRKRIGAIFVEEDVESWARSFVVVTRPKGAGPA